LGRSEEVGSRYDIETGVTYTFFKSRWLERDQVRVVELTAKAFLVKCGKDLTDQEIKGAIVKYVLSKGKRINAVRD
jgi:hypothetical protein